MIIKELRTAMFLLGAKNIEQLTGAEVVFSKNLKVWA